MRATGNPRQGAGEAALGLFEFFGVGAPLEVLDGSDAFGKVVGFGFKLNELAGKLAHAVDEQAVVDLAGGTSSKEQVVTANFRFFGSKGKTANIDANAEHRGK